MACVCGLPSPPLRCPGVVRYVATTTTTTVSSTATLGGLDVPDDPDARAALVAALEDALFDVVAAGLRAGSGTLIGVTVTSIGGNPVRRWLRGRRTVDPSVQDGANGNRELAQSTSVEFQSTVISTRSVENSSEEERVEADVADDILTQVSSALTDASAVQEELATSGNPIVQGAILESVDVNPIVETTSETRTVTGTRLPTVSYSFRLAGWCLPAHYIDIS